jgi:putative transposase
MLIMPRKRYVQTTDSKHWLRKYPNKIKEIQVEQPNEIWVSDITYIKTEEGNCYLNLITDKYSRAIVGYAIDDNMEAKNMIKAYHMAIKFKHNNIPTIHHSDRGMQYCSKDYVQLASENQIMISMTENGDPYENALAERMNRTLKEEFGLGEVIKDRKTAIKMTKEAVLLYNNYRPHNALKLQTPISVHLHKTKIPANLLHLQG